MQCFTWNNSMDEKDKIKCIECRQTRHYSCAGLSEAKFTKMLPMNRLKWKCAGCRENVSAKNTPPPPDAAAAFAPLPCITDSPSEFTSGAPSMVNIDTNALISYIEAKFTAMRDEYRAFTSFLQDKLDSITGNMATWDARLTEVEARVQVVTEENATLRKEMDILRQQQDDSEQRGRMCNIDIHNIPEKKGENLLSIVETIGSLIGVPLPVSCVVSVHRVAPGRLASYSPAEHHCTMISSLYILRPGVCAMTSLRPRAHAVDSPQNS